MVPDLGPLPQYSATMVYDVEYIPGQFLSNSIHHFMIPERQIEYFLLHNGPFQNEIFDSMNTLRNKPESYSRNLFVHG